MPIHILEDSLINKIAAGEVVERPASVVKELVENSIDAKADSVIIEIKDGGTSYIRITDNGCGIDKEQLVYALLRHATSKIECFNDLSNVLTLGFRGEALSSIAAVSNMELITKTKESKYAGLIRADGGLIGKPEITGAADGTTVVVRNLFYNTPARRKFLKKDSAEGGAVSDVVNRLALGHPNIAFKYINNGNIVLNTSGKDDIKTTVFNVYGKDIVKKMIQLSYEKNGFLLSGLIGKPELNRANRNYENFFINGRFVKSSVVSNALEQAYKGRLMQGKFPVFVLNMTVPEKSVDVNVHPAKLEVRFSDDEFIYDFVYEAITKSFKENVLIPKIEIKKSVFDVKPKKTVQEEITDINILNSEFVETEYKYDENLQIKETPEIIIHDYLGFSDNSNIEELSVKEDFECDFDIISKINGDIEENIYTHYEDRENNIIETYVENEEQSKSEKSFLYNCKIIGQIFNTYWIVEKDSNKMFLIDQHAAHERALYEKLLNEFKSNKVVSQQLLVPVCVEMTPNQMQAIYKNKKLLKDFGFDAEKFGERTYLLREVPFIFKGPVEPSFLSDLADLLQNKKIVSIYDTLADAIATMSCKAAVKANDKLSYQEAEELIKWLIKLENPFSCPHGRPTIIEITKYEVEKMFKRKDI